MTALPQEMTFIAHGSGGGPEVLVPARGPLPAAPAPGSSTWPGPAAR
jgi:NADPH2:quinone reductase